MHFGHLRGKENAREAQRAYRVGPIFQYSRVALCLASAPFYCFFFPLTSSKHVFGPFITNVDMHSDGKCFDLIEHRQLLFWIQRMLSYGVPLHYFLFLTAFTRMLGSH